MDDIEIYDDCTAPEDDVREWELQEELIEMGIMDDPWDD